MRQKIAFSIALLLTCLVTSLFLVTTALADTKPSKGPKIVEKRKPDYPDGERQPKDPNRDLSDLLLLPRSQAEYKIIPVSTCSVALWDRTAAGPDFRAPFHYNTLRSCLIDIPDGSTIKAIWISRNLRESDLLRNTDINVEVWEKKFSGEDKFLCQEMTVPGTGRCENLGSKKSSKNSFVVDIYDQVITNNSDLWKYYYSQVRAIKVEYEDE